MTAQKQRLYLGNLTSDIVEDEIAAKLSKYGTVESIEIKHREPFSFAYVNLQTKYNDLERCFQEIRSQEWNGNYVKIDVAKESFLDRLARERNSINLKNKWDVSSAERVCNENSVVKKSESKKIDYSSDSSDSDSSVKRKVHMFRGTKRYLDSQSDINKMSKKKCRSFSEKEDSNKVLWTSSFSNNSKETETSSHKTSTKIFDTLKNKKEASHIEDIYPVITESTLSNGNERKRVSEETRLKSLQARRDIFNKQKALVKIGLSSVDLVRSMNKKVVFDSDNETDIANISVSKKKAERHHRDLFSDDDSSDNENITVKKQFEGEKGQKLLELQTRYGNDERFRLDERFYEGDEDEYADKDKDNQNEEKQGDYIDKIDQTSERLESLKILEDVLGHSVTKDPPKKQQQKNKVMVRFDPTKPEHQKFEVKESDDSLTNKSSKKKTKIEDTSTPVPTVSETKFYEVSDVLKESLKNKSDSFSIREIFGTADDDDVHDEPEVPVLIKKVDKEDSAKEKSKKKQFGPDRNPFVYDSSDDEVEDEQKKPEVLYSTQKPLATFNKNKFFFSPDDDRFKETLDLLFENGEVTESAEDFREKRRELKRVIRQKLRNYQKSNDPLKKHAGKYVSSKEWLKHNKTQRSRKFR